MTWFSVFVTLFYRDIITPVLQMKNMKLREIKQLSKATIYKLPELDLG